MDKSEPKSGIFCEQFYSRKAEHSTSTKNINKDRLQNIQEETFQTYDENRNEDALKSVVKHNNKNSHKQQVAKATLYEKLKWFLIDFAIALLCFIYCHFSDSSYREMTSNWLLGEHEAYRVNWWWWLCGIVFIVFAVKTIIKYNEMKKAYKYYKLLIKEL